MPLVTRIFLEVPSEAVVSAAVKDRKNGSDVDVALILSFVAITATEKTYALKRGCAIFLIFPATLRVFVQKCRHLPSPCRPMAVSSQNDNGSFLGIFTHLGSTWQEEVNGLDRKNKTQRNI